MKDGFDFDGALKDLFQQDRPKLLEDMTGGIAIREFLNVELPKVQERRVDLLVSLVDGSMLHLEFQSANQTGMAYRMVIYHALLAQRYRRPLRQVVLYVGQQKMRMANRLDTGSLRFSYELRDIREVPVDDLLRTGKPPDLALAILARGGPGRMREIIGRIASLKGSARDRALAQLVVLSGLRSLPRQVQMEAGRMGVVIDARKNEVLMQWRREAIEEGKAEGLTVGKQEVLRDLLEAKFGRLPKWAVERLESPTPTQVEKWLKRVLTGDSLEAVIGKRQSS